MDIASREHLVEILTGTIREVCAHWGLAPEPLASPIGALEIVGVIGFTGEALRGSLGLGADRALLHRILGPVSDDMAEDWLGEATNQLLGRTKNRLVAQGVSLAVALPMVLRGLRIETRPGDAGVITFPMTTSAGSLVVWFDVKAEASFVLRATPPDTEPCAAEGEIVLF